MMFLKFLIVIFYFSFFFAGKAFAAPFIDNGNGTVKDKATGLIWQKCSNGQNATDCSGTANTSDWTASITYCTGLTLASKVWRLPNINELKSILDYSKTSSPMIDTAIFPNTAVGYYWSSTTYSPITSSAWYLGFDISTVLQDPKSSPYYVRCVSGP